MNNNIYLPNKHGIFILKNNKISILSKQLSFNIIEKTGKQLFTIDLNYKLSIRDTDTDEIQLFETPVQEILKSDEINSIIKIDNDKFAIVTLTDKIIIINNQGDICRIICNENGLMNGKIYRIYTDADKNLWVCMSNGIAKIDINFPVQHYGEKHNIKNNVFTTVKFGGNTYIGSIDGISYMPDKSTDNYKLLNKFEKINAYTSECWEFKILNNKLFALCSTGIWHINGTVANIIYKPETILKPHCFSTHPSFKNVFFVGMNGQLDVVQLNDFSVEKQIKVIENFSLKGVSNKIRRITPDTDGNLWINTQYDGIYFVRFINNNINDYRVTLLDQSNNLTELDGTRTFIVGDKVQIGTYSGLLTPVFPKIKNAPDSLIKFAPSLIFGKKIDEIVRVIIPYGNQNYILSTPNTIFFANTATQKFDTAGFYRLNIPIRTMILNQDSVISFCGSEGLYNYDLKNKRDFNKKFNVVISRFEAGKDSVIFFGTHYYKSGKNIVTSLLQNSEDFPQLSHFLNSATFHFSALFYEEPENTEYQYQLKNFDKSWSEWTKETKAHYTNIDNGKYTFRVRARNVYGVISDTAEYTFIMLPPWYKTVWAYIVYTILLALAYYSGLRYYTRQLHKRQKKLESVIEDRTQEIKKQSEDLLQANLKLVELDKFKQSVTGMIVHDLKNPINAIINANESNAEEQLRSLKQKGRQMLNLVLNILDIYKYEESEIALDISRHNLSEICEAAIENVKFLADEKNITIQSENLSAFDVDVDYEMMLRVFENILTNAIKFSPLNEKIDISTNIIASAENNGFIMILIFDNGAGISSDKKQLVFEKFGQINAKNSGIIKSTGLGLTYCKMVVEAHKGEINLESETGKGTTFWFTLPYHSENNSTKTKEETFVYSPSVNSLSEQDFNKISAYIEKLQETEIYKITELTNILNQIEPTNTAVKRWKENILSAINSGNNELYQKLLTSNKSHD